MSHNLGSSPWAGVLRTQEILSSASPYVYKLQRFLFKTMTLADLTPQRIEKQGVIVELILISARQANTGLVNVWNETLTAGKGIPLNASDNFSVAVDNQLWNVSQAFSQILNKQNTQARYGLDAGDWFVVANAANQTVDILFGYGPET